MASDTQNDGDVSQPTLLGLPAELRNSIYFLVAAGNTRPLLVSRLMQLEAERALRPPNNRSNVTLENRLNNAVGFHPLSQTCRQLRDEFQPVFLHHSAPCHRLIINNFNVAQSEFVANFFRKHRMVDLWQDRVRRYVYASGVVGRIEVDFRRDSDIVKSAEALLHHILKLCELRKEPNGLSASASDWARARGPTQHMAIYNIHSQLDIRRRTPDMSPRQAAKAVTALQLEETGRIFRFITSIVRDVNFALDERRPWSEEAVRLIRKVCREALARSFEDGPKWEPIRPLRARRDRLKTPQVISHLRATCSSLSSDAEHRQGTFFHG